jgi:ABC-type Mn2+/Zn2+ transport system permease subunit
MMVLAIVACMIFTVVGLAVSFQTGLPSGPVIVMLAAGAYLTVEIGQQFWR